MSAKRSILLLCCSGCTLAMLVWISLAAEMESVPADFLKDSPANSSPPSALPVQVESSPEERKVRSPADIVSLMQAFHSQRAYPGIAPWIIEEQRDETIRLLIAVDGVMDANAALQRAARQQYHTAKADGWNLSAMENNLGPFSSQLRLINQRFCGDTAIVTLQEGSNIPLVPVEFKWTGERWCYVPEDVPDGIHFELARLTRILRDITESIKRGAPFDAYMDAFLYRVLPQMARVATVTDDPVATAAIPVDES